MKIESKDFCIRECGKVRLKISCPERDKTCRKELQSIRKLLVK